jgi:hypothetical protein
MAVLTCSSFVTSQAKSNEFSPTAALADFKSSTATRAPSLTSFFVIDSPIPDAPPVTTAT